MVSKTRKLKIPLIQRTSILFVLLLVISGYVTGQSALNSPLGDFRNAETGNQELTIHTTNGTAKIEVYSPTVIRFRAVRDTFVRTFSYAVVANKKTCILETAESDSVYTVYTDSIYIKIRKYPVRFAFYTRSGRLINADDHSFGVSWIGNEITTYKKLHPGERFIGLGEHTGNLDRRGESYTNWNTDDPGYSNSSRSLYASIPFYIGLHDSLIYGIFLDNSSQTTFNFGAGNNRFVSFTANCGEMDYYFIFRSNVRGVIEEYTWLTGRTPLPPRWSLGYQQCRYSYFPDTDVLSVARKFRERSIPADMIYLDIHYMDSFRIFTWDRNRFPDPAGMTEKLKSIGFHTTVIVDPGVKIDNNYEVYRDGLQSGIFIKYPDGINYTGEVWPGWCNFPDFTMPKAREWWGKWIKTYTDAGITGFWNDMNEIAVWGKDVPGLLELSWEGKRTSYNEGKNVYGLLMARSSYEGARKHLNGQRPFILTRAGYSGLQRYTAIWTGDNQSTDEHMMLGVRLLNSMGISGISFSGMDIGGFSGNPSQDLYIRWMQLGAFLPLFRQHTAVYTTRSEPWTMGEIAEDITRRYIGFRYQLMPYLYATFYESSVNGMPVVRSLAIDHPFSPRIFDAEFQQQFMFGPSIMVAPVKSSERLAKVLLPEGEWYSLFNDSIYSGNRVLLTECPIEEIPVFIKAGSIMPAQKLTGSTSENPGDTLFVHVYKGGSISRFTYYEDDGNTYRYKQDQYYRRDILYDSREKYIELTPKTGQLASGFPVVCIIFHGFRPSELMNVRVNRKKHVLTKQSFRFFTSLFPFADFGPDDTKTLLSVSFRNLDEKMLIQWQE